MQIQKTVIHTVLSFHVETVCLLSKLNAKQHIEVEIKMDELDLTSVESKATYDEIKACDNPRCGKYFLVKTTSTRNRYCSTECCNRVTQDRYRKRKRELAEN